jgi:hypothetical protein
MTGAFLGGVLDAVREGAEMSPLALFVLIVVGPILVGATAMVPCGARNRNGTRCIRKRSGLMERCHNHTGQGIAPSDWFGVICVAAGLFFVWRAFYPGPILGALLL